MAEVFWQSKYVLDIVIHIRLFPTNNFIIMTLILIVMYNFQEKLCYKSIGMSNYFFSQYTKKLCALMVKKKRESDLLASIYDAES